MSIKLTQKETKMLQDQKKHEEICIQKYKDYANKAQDPQLKQLFNTHASHEEQHLNTINQILNGQVPGMAGQQNPQQGQQMQGQGRQMQQLSAQSQMVQPAMQQMASQSDAFLCNDLLMTEKYVSGTYDTTIFECTDSNVRQALNHIQKEEQKHGEDLFNYLRSHGMYNLQ